MIYPLNNLWKDLRFALRQLRKRPGFTITAIAVLGLAWVRMPVFSVWSMRCYWIRCPSPIPKKWRSFVSVT